MQVEIRAALEKFRRGDTENAFFELIEMTDDVLPAIVDIFRGEPQPHVRAFLVKAAWERREDAVIPFLAEALNDDAEEVWQEALDGLVAFFVARVIGTPTICTFSQVQRLRCQTVSPLA